MTDLGGTGTSLPQPPALAAVLPWPSERRWLRVMLVLSVPLWTLLVYYVNLGVLGLLLVWLVLSRTFRFVAHLRGSAVRIGPNQLPALARRVEEMARQVGLKDTPEVYVMQQNGVLNAFAMRIFRHSFVVLNSDLLDACGDNTDARDFIIGHELGHHAAKHLLLQGVLAPVRLVPFLWKAYSRAREYTCDRYGMAVVKDRRAALRGLAILGAGRTLGPALDLEAYVRQRAELHRPMAKLGSWLSTHPPLCERIAMLDPALNAIEPLTNPFGVRLRATAIATFAFALPYLLIVGSSPAPFIAQQLQLLASRTYMLSFWLNARHAAAATSAEEKAESEARVRVEGQRAVAALVVAVERFAKANGRLPYDGEVRSAWTQSFGDTPYPEDPDFEGPYHYSTNGRAYLFRASCEGCSYLSEGGGTWGDWKLELSEIPVEPTAGTAKPAAQAASR